jgi:hypothetical protein
VKGTKNASEQTDPMEKQQDPESSAALKRAAMPMGDPPILSSFVFPQYIPYD